MKCKEEDIKIRDNETFATFLRKKRLGMGLNQDDFGYFLDGLRQTTICSWEKGATSPPINDAKRYIEFLGGKLQIVNEEDYVSEFPEKQVSSKDRLSELEERYPRSRTMAV